MENARVSHYELRRLLGRGGMGEVHEAFDLKARRPVALKFVAPELAADPDAFRRFDSEALHAAALNHPHIATLFEFEPEGERPFIAMELVPGPSLRERIDAGTFRAGRNERDHRTRPAVCGGRPSIPRPARAREGARPA